MEQDKAGTELYDAQETLEKMRRALEMLQKQQSPGQLVKQRVKKTELLRSKESVDMLKPLIAQGYTAAQIAAFLRDGDVFNVLPKTITQVLNSATKDENTQVNKPKRQRKQKEEHVTEHKEEQTNVRTKVGGLDVNLNDEV